MDPGQGSQQTAGGEDGGVCTPPGKNGSGVHGAEQGAGGFSLPHLALSSVPLLGGHRKKGVNGRAMAKAADDEGLLQASRGSSLL